VLRRAFTRISQLQQTTAALRFRLESLELERTPGEAPAVASPPIEYAGAVAQEGVPTLQPAPVAASEGTQGPQARTGQDSPLRFPPIAQDDDTGDSLETRIGGQWLLYIGVIAVVVGVAYFEKLAIERQWIGETARVVHGLLFGLALMVGGHRFGRAGYRAYGQAITGAGGAILYVSTFAAFVLYHLIERPLAFTAMVAITATVAWLADRERSQGLALFAVGGGFITPFLMRGGTDMQVALFTYDAVLIGGTMALSRRHDWPVLNIISYLFTLLTVAAWADRFYGAHNYLSTELFITLFCAMFLYVLRECRGRAHAQNTATAAALWTAPVAYYLGSLAILADHPTAMLVWFVAMMLAGGVVSARMGALAGLTVWTAVTLPLLVWTQVHMGAGAWLLPGLAAVAGVYVIALAAQLYCSLERDDFGAAAIAWLHGNGLLMFAAAYFLVAPNHLSGAAALGALFALWHWGIAWMLSARRREQAIHFVALGFTLMAVAIAIEFDGPTVTIGWAAEGAAVVALGLHERRWWLRLTGHLLFAIAVGRTVDLVLAAAPAGHVPLFNARTAAGLFVIALCYLLAWLFQRDPHAPHRRLGIDAPLVAAQVITLALLTGEINAYWSSSEWTFERQLMLSATWALFALVLIVIGLRTRYAPIRYFAILVFSLTIAKVFFVDLANLDRVYRVISVIGLGVILLVTSYLYQRSRGMGLGSPGHE
jgi:uncharacterized membrane protein